MEAVNNPADHNRHGQITAHRHPGADQGGDHGETVGDKVLA
jgi:hypothetical protein